MGEDADVEGVLAGMVEVEGVWWGKKGRAIGEIGEGARMVSVCRLEHR